MKLLKYPNESLATPCTDVAIFDESLHLEIDEMKRIMREEGGAGLSANQVGLHKRMFVMLSTDGNLYEFINPTIDKYGEIGKWFREGCLSTKNVYEYIDRYEAVIIKAVDRDNKEISFYAVTPRDSVCVQHEMEHLDGRIWWDNLPKNSKKRLVRIYEKKND